MRLDRKRAELLGQRRCRPVRGELEEVGLELAVALLVKAHVGVALAEAHSATADANRRAPDIEDALALLFEEAVVAMGREEHKVSLPTR
ncbi:MAG: hypothetical protein FJ144_12555 [Deltaproteobacteria bacterium]|nr:hypothetical protein [Deltaproteobacteria bacterium]